MTTSWNGGLASNDDTMKIKFYGTRGSIPVPEREFMEFGGNTTCVEKECQREFGDCFMAREGQELELS